MIPPTCKRLAEVDFPIAEVSRHAAREKSIRHGHPSTLHLWWARRPLASSRAVLMALLLPDPCDPSCPEDFRAQARRILLGMTGRPQGWDEQLRTDEGLRKVLLKFIADFANWDNAAEPRYLETARGLVRAAHPEEPPLVVDPFAGGGSIPLEALRVGCDAFASDLNPVACLILKVMLEDIPRHGPALADELRKAGAEILERAREELADLYPPDPDGATPIAYLWARTVRCEAPNCGAEIPLMRSLWLAKKELWRRERGERIKTRGKQALRLLIHREEEGARDGCDLCRRGEFPHVTFEIFEPASGSEVQPGTVAAAKATCPCCHSVLPPARVRAQLAAQRGGADAVFDEHGNRMGGARMTAVVTLKPDERGRHYRLPTEADYAAVRRAQERLAGILHEWERGGKEGLCPVPDEPTPAGGGSGAGRAFSVQRYGMLRWGDLFTARQKVAIIRLAGEMAVSSRSASLQRSGALAISRCTEQSSTLVRWRTTVEAVAGTFGRNALPMMWDFVEIQPLGASSSNFSAAIQWVAEVIEKVGECLADSGQVENADAVRVPLPDETVHCWFTDPPYYDAIPYSDLSDFFFVWLKRSLPNHPLLRNPLNPEETLTPKIQEAVQDETKMHDGRPKDRAWFEETMANAFAEGRRVLSDDGIGSVVFAHKTTEGWEALLSGLIRGGWTITGSWPIATERPGRLRSQDSAALATSVHLVCRPRPEDASVGDWAKVLRELPGRVAAWMARLQNEGIRGADLVFACIGPALEIFSRYRRVETAEGREVGLAEYLERVWEVVGRAALEQVLGTGDATSGALEEDARLTALFLWTLQSTDAGNGNGSAEDDDEEALARIAAKGLALPFDVVRRFAQPLGIALPTWERRVIETKKGAVRLLPVAERAKLLFGDEGAGGVADWIEADAGTSVQQALFPEMAPQPGQKRGRRSRAVVGADAELESPDATTLDRVHAAMLLQAGGRANALRKLIEAELDRGPAFLRLANALSALYPRGSEEKRLLDAMLLAVPR